MNFQAKVFLINKTEKAHLQSIKLKMSASKTILHARYHLVEQSFNSFSLTGQTQVNSFSDLSVLAPSGQNKRFNSIKVKDIRCSFYTLSVNECLQINDEQSHKQTLFIKCTMC